MSDRKTFILAHKRARDNAVKAVIEAPEFWSVELRGPRRSGKQSDLMWGLLTDLAEQHPWHGQKITPDDYKEMITAALKKQRVIPGLEGGFVVLGARTSKMTVGEMNEVIEYCYAFGAQNGVQFFTDAVAA